MQPQDNNSIFWIDTGRVRPNPYQPRRTFDEDKLRDLAESIRQYGILQPLVVTRHEVEKADGGIVVEYELIAGERRLRASRIAEVGQVPVVIRNVEDNERVKLEIAIVENIQREDLNPIDRALAFSKLVKDFNFKHIQVAKKVNKSREYISNSLRLLSLPKVIQTALAEGKITEGHTRPLMMLCDRKEEQDTLFEEILLKKLTVRDAEGIARRIAQDKIRKKDNVFSSEILEMEKNLTKKLGTRVQIESREIGGKITIDFSSEDDLKQLLEHISKQQNKQEEIYLEDINEEEEISNTNDEKKSSEELEVEKKEKMLEQQKKEEQENLEMYNIKNFTI